MSSTDEMIRPPLVELSEQNVRRSLLELGHEDVSNDRLRYLTEAVQKLALEAGMPPSSLAKQRPHRLVLEDVVTSCDDFSVDMSGTADVTASYASSSESNTANPEMCVTRTLDKGQRYMQPSSMGVSTTSGSQWTGDDGSRFRATRHAKAASTGTADLTRTLAGRGGNGADGIDHFIAAPIDLGAGPPIYLPTSQQQPYLHHPHQQLDVHTRSPSAGTLTRATEAIPPTREKQMSKGPVSGRPLGQPSHAPMRDNTCGPGDTPSTYYKGRASQLPADRASSGYQRSNDPVTPSSLHALDEHATKLEAIARETYFRRTQTHQTGMHPPAPYQSAGISPGNFPSHRHQHGDTGISGSSTKATHRTGIRAAEASRRSAASRVPDHGLVGSAPAKHGSAVAPRAGQRLLGNDQETAVSLGQGGGEGPGGDLSGTKAGRRQHSGRPQQTTSVRKRIGNSAHLPPPQMKRFVLRHRDGVAEVTDESFVSESEGVCDGGEAVAGTAPTATGQDTAASRMAPSAITKHRHTEEAYSSAETWDEEQHGYYNDENNYDIVQRPSAKSVIHGRPSSRPGSRGTQKSDPVLRYHQFNKEWSSLKLPGQEKHKRLRWNVREAMAQKYEVERDRVRQPLNTYVVPTEKRRQQLRWNVRSSMAARGDYD